VEHVACRGGRSLEIVEVRLDGALSNLSELKMSLLTVSGVGLDDV